MSLARILGKSKGRQSYVVDSRWVLPDSFIGVEVEYEGVTDRTLPIDPNADFWTHHEEGSLRDNGSEYVFSGPLFGLDAYNAIEWLVSHAKASKWKCTKRTGIHVHSDVRDLTVPQFAGHTILYAALEPILYRWVGDGRASSHFCYPLYKADDALLNACEVLRAAHRDDKEGEHTVLSTSETVQRYCGYNLQSLQKFGSVEFRHLQTTHNFERIVDWINMIQSLKKTAYKIPQSDGALVRMLEKMTAAEVLEYTFPPELAAKLYTKHSNHEFLNVGLPSSRDVAVHGCSENDWNPFDFPKGENEGFIKWSKNYKKPKKTVSPPQDFDDFIDPEEPEEENNLIPPPALAGRAAVEAPRWLLDPPIWDDHPNRPAIPVAPQLEINPPIPPNLDAILDADEVRLRQERARQEIDRARQRMQEELNRRVRIRPRR